MTFKESIPIAKELAENELRKHFDADAFIILALLDKLDVSVDLVPESTIDESIENILKNNAMTKEELLIKYTQLETKVNDNTKNIDTLFSRFNLVKYTAKNRLRNSGEFTTDTFITSSYMSLF